MKKKLFYIFLALITLLLFTSCSKQDCTLPPEKQTRIIKSEAIYLYPYKDLSTELKEKGIFSLKLFVYGSLMNKESLQKTISHGNHAQARPAIAFGLQRLFNLDVPYRPDSKWGPLATPDSRGMLNVRRTENSEVFINGIIIDVPIEDLGALSEREQCYNLVPVITADWHAFLNGKFVFSTAYTLLAPERPGITSDSILPRTGYFEFARAAAQTQGSCFEEFWLNTTYLSDGTTSISAWISKKN